MVRIHRAHKYIALFWPLASMAADVSLITCPTALCVWIHWSPTQDIQSMTHTLQHTIFHSLLFLTVNSVQIYSGGVQGCSYSKHIWGHIAKDLLFNPAGAETGVFRQHTMTVDVLTHYVARTQQPRWHWLCRINAFLFVMKKDYNYPRHISSEKR